MKPLISVIIPCHNDHARLPQALRSFLDQQHSAPFEIIVVDDASTPSVLPICKQFNVRYARLESKNANAARNRGTALARGEILVYFDADNLALPDFLASLTAPLRSGQADICYGQRQLIGSGSSGRYSFFNQLLYRHEELKMGSCIDTACAVRRTILPDKPWDESLDRYQDWDFHLSMMERGARYAFVDHLVYHYWLPALTALENLRNSRIRISNYDLVRYKHRLDQSGVATITLALAVSSKRDLTIKQPPKPQTNLLILDASNDADFFIQTLLPFVVKQRSAYAGVFVSVQPNCTLPQNRLEARRVLLRQTTTPQILFADDKTPHQSAALKLSFTADTNRPHYKKTTLVLHSVTDFDCVNRWLFVANIPPSAIDLHLIAADPLAHQRLSQAPFFAGTTLAGRRRNLADYLNQLISQTRQTIVIASAQTVPVNFLLEHAHRTLPSAAAVACTIHTTDGQAWNGHTVVPSTPKLQLELCVINPNLVQAPLFEPRLAADRICLGMAAALELNRRQLPVTTADWPLATTRQSSTKLTTPNWYYLGILFGCYIPVQQLGSFMLNILWRGLQAGPIATMQFLWGWIVDTVSRLNRYSERHFRTP